MPQRDEMPLNILLTNDDGYNAPGLVALYDALVADGENVHIVAPAANQSAQGSSLGGTAAVAQPFAVTEFSPGNYFVEGRPVTATLVGLDVLDLFGGAEPDIVVSGTNRGDNTGESANISGTVNAAVAALGRGIPAIALSAGADAGDYDAAYANSAAFLVILLDRLDAARPDGAPLIPGAEGLSINIPGTPDPVGVAATRIDQESAASFPIGEKPNGLYNSTLIANTAPSGNPLSEGAQFLADRLTVSPIDGSWSASEQARLDLSMRLNGSLGDGHWPDVQPLKVLLVNDEGADAPGLEVLRDVLLLQGAEVTVTAPATPQQNVGTALTLTDFAVTRTDAGYTVAATPSTAIYTAFDALLTDTDRPDLVISGIDTGPSLGLPAFTSGTLAAAVASVFNYQVPAIAVSTEVAPQDGSDWATLWRDAGIVGELVSELGASAGRSGAILPPGLGLNVNIPLHADPSDIAFTRIDAATDRALRAEGSDVPGQARLVFDGPVTTPDPLAEGNAFAAGHITISPIDANYASANLASYDRIAALLGVSFGIPGNDGIFEPTTVKNLDFLGEAEVPFGTSFGGLQIGGLSALTWDAARHQFYALSDDRSADARFYTLTLGLEDGTLGKGEVAFTGVQTLSDANGDRFTPNTLDPEGLTLASSDRFFLSSEGDAAALIAPFVDSFDLHGQRTGSLPIPERFLPTADQSSGIRNNLAFEALTLTPDGRHLYVGTENALYQDGPNATITGGTPSRVLAYDVASREETAEYVYQTDPVQATPVPSDAFATNGLVELLALDNHGALLALERSFSTGVGNDIKLFLVSTEGATDVSGLSALRGETYQPLQKTLLLDFADLGITLDNVEGMTFGPDLADGRRSLVLVADDNFSNTQVTQFLAFGLDLGRSSVDIL